jgi:hypothetical protein
MYLWGVFAQRRMVRWTVDELRTVGMVRANPPVTHEPRRAQMRISRFARMARPLRSPDATALSQPETVEPVGVISKDFFQLLLRAALQGPLEHTDPS